MEKFETFYSRIDRTSPIIVACCVLHNYCEMWGAPKLGLANARINGDNLMGFGVDRLPIVKEREHAKVEGERLKRVFLVQGDWSSNCTMTK